MQGLAKKVGGFLKARAHFNKYMKTCKKKSKRQGEMPSNMYRMVWPLASLRQ
jgi:hypothetical protein